MQLTIVINLYGAHDKKEFIGKNVLNFLVKEERARVIQESLNSIATNKGHVRDYLVRLKNGGVISLVIKTTFMKNRKGENTGFVNLIKMSPNRANMLL
jgi:hypothetical protein